MFLSFSPPLTLLSLSSEEDGTKGTHLYASRERKQWAFDFVLLAGQTKLGFFLCLRPTKTLIYD